MLARAMLAVVQVPQLGALVAWVPRAKFVAQAEDALLGTGLLLVPASAAEDRVEPVVSDGVEQRLGLQRVARAVGALGQAAIIDVVLHRGDLETYALLGDGAVAKGQHLREVVTGVHVQQGEWDGSWPEGLRRQVQHDHGVFAA